MEITEVRLRLTRNLGRLKATASITIDDSIVIHDLRIVENNGELFVAMPNKRMNSGEYRDIAHPINQEVRAYVVEKVLDEYKRVCEEVAKHSEENNDVSSEAC